MAQDLKQSTAVAISFGPFVDPTDGVTLVTGAVSAIDNGTTGIKLSKNGGALTIRHASVTASSYDAYGNYIVTLDTTDTNTLGTLRVQFAAAATCLVVWQDFSVITANAWDSKYGSATRQADVTKLNADATAAANIAKTTRAIGRGTVTTGGSTTSIPTSAFTPAGAAADQFKGRIITFDADTTTTALRGQSTDITASSNASTPTFTVTALTSNPASGDTFSVT